MLAHTVPAMAARGVRRFVFSCLFVLTGALLTAQIALAGTSTTPKPSRNLGEQTPLHLPTSPAGHASTVSSPTISGGSVVKTFIVLILVVGLIYGIARLIRRFNPSRFPKLQATGEIEVLATQALFQGRLLHVVRVGDKVMVLGSTDQSVSRLASLNEEDIESMLSLKRAGQTPSAGAASFRGTLASVVSAKSQRPQRPERDPDAPKGSFLERLRDMTSR